MKVIHVLSMLALIAGGYFIRDVVEPTKEAEARVSGMNADQLSNDPDFSYSVRVIVHQHCEWGTTSGWNNQKHIIQC